MQKFLQRVVVLLVLILFFRSAFSQTPDYLYDASGNVIRDGNKGVKLSYNHLNLISEVQAPEGVYSYTYDALGNKLSRKETHRDGTTVTRYYIGGLEYEATNQESPKLERVATGEGHLTPEENNTPIPSLHYSYALSDHRGHLWGHFGEGSSNAALTTSSNALTALLEQFQGFYPYGGDQPQQRFSRGQDDKYGPTGKEQQPSGDYDFGARWIDPYLAVWNAVDPKAETRENISRSPNSYVNGDPNRFIDPDGKHPILIGCLVIAGGYFLGREAYFTWQQLNTGLTPEGKEATGMDHLKAVGGTYFAAVLSGIPGAVEKMGATTLTQAEKNLAILEGITAMDKEIAEATLRGANGGRAWLQYLDESLVATRKYMNGTLIAMRKGYNNAIRTLKEQREELIRNNGSQEEIDFISYNIELVKQKIKDLPIGIKNAENIQVPPKDLPLTTPTTNGMVHPSPVFPTNPVPVKTRPN